MAPGARPSFGVARPMKGGAGAAKAAPVPGGEQFPPLPGEADPFDASSKGDAMTRLDPGWLPD